MQKVNETFEGNKTEKQKRNIMMVIRSTLLCKRGQAQIGGSWVDDG